MERKLCGSKELNKSTMGGERGWKQAHREGKKRGRSLGDGRMPKEFLPSRKVYLYGLKCVGGGQVVS